MGYTTCLSCHFPNNSSRHKYMLFLSTDGNFRLQRKHKNGDPDGYALNQGNGYFVENTQYKKYLACVHPGCDVCSIMRSSRYSVSFVATEIYM